MIFSRKRKPSGPGVYLYDPRTDCVDSEDARPPDMMFLGMADYKTGDLFIESYSSIPGISKFMTQDLIKTFPNPLFFMSVEVGRKKEKEKLLAKVPDMALITIPQENPDFLSFVGEYSPQLVDDYTNLYIEDPSYWLWTFGVCPLSSGLQLGRLAEKVGILNIDSNPESKEDGMRHLMPYYIICEEDWGVIRVRCMDESLFDDFIDYVRRWKRT